MSKSTSEYISTAHWSSSAQGLVSNLVQHGLNSAQDMLARVSLRGRLRTIAQTGILSTFENIKYGRLTVCTPEGTLEFGQPFLLQSDGVPRDLTARIDVMDEEFWTRLFLHPDFGFADAYMLHMIEVDSLENVFRMFILNRKHLGEMHSLVSPILRAFSFVANSRYANSLSGSKRNISVHYDLPEELFTGFLSWDMTYSCAIFDDEAGGHTGDLTSKRPIAPPRMVYLESRSDPPDDLERGQLAKLHRIAQKARLKKGSRVLEIGCGWGSFAILAARHYGAIVDTLTISESQKVATEQNVSDAGLSDSITVHLMDYRDMPAIFHKAFDAVVSIGVTEHVGIEYLDTWFQKISWAMKSEDSFKVFTMSTVPDTRWLQYQSEVDFFRKYIYPGAALSTVGTLVNAITKVGLNVESIEDLSPHYTRTAREWGYRFQRNFDTHIKPAFKKQHPEISDEQLEIFRRKWIYYFAYCEGGFALRCIYDHLFVVTREHNTLGY
ncbi:hypothetical protein HGRIS_005707 [Hohenbuehelia grisea]|uniref:Cyclopropane-fatty-acyl-phospholipid synthase n=1 Tax=Hohenbuehelia grisea TaxID=104357 RepID=A0ABR3JXL9_9AGAR